MCRLYLSRRSGRCCGSLRAYCRYRPLSRVFLCVTKRRSAGGIRKFFALWRRLSISCDYGVRPPGPARPGNALVIASLKGRSLDGCHAAVVDGQAAQWSEESADKSLIHRTPCTSSAQSGGRHYAQSGHSSQSWLQQRTYSSFE